jgi:3-oxoadipate enol-lactonase
MHQVTVRTGPTIAYSDEGSGVPLILGHGFMLDSEMFTPISSSLSKRFRIITWDARAHGQTKYDGKPFSEWDNVEDLIALMDALGIERAYIGGHSQGGFVAMSAALRHPDRVLGLVLISTTPHGQDKTNFPGLEAFISEWQRTGPTSELCQMLSGMVFGGAGTDSWARKWMRQPKENINNPINAVFEREDIYHRLGEIVAPALVIHGTDDAEVPLEEAEEFTRRIPNARPLVVIEGAPHASCCTHPELTINAIGTFLAEESRKT